jgi:hypothetical protein
MNAVNRILGEAIRPPTEAEKTDPQWAYHYAKNVLKGHWPEGEPAIATDPYYAYRYARCVLKGRFPEGEKTLAADPWSAYHYAEDVLKGRFQEGEVAIAAHPSCVTNYLRLFPEAKLDWAMNGLIDWTDL